MSEQSNQESNGSGHHVVISADTHCGAALVYAHRDCVVGVVPLRRVVVWIGDSDGQREGVRCYAVVGE